MAHDTRAVTRVVVAATTKVTYPVPLGWTSRCFPVSPPYKLGLQQETPVPMSWETWLSVALGTVPESNIVSL